MLVIFDGLGNLPVQYWEHHPMKDVLGYIRGLWKLPPDNYPYHIALAAAKVIGFGTHQLWLCLWKWLLWSSRSKKAQNGASTHVIDAASLMRRHDWSWRALLFSCHQMLTTNKNTEEADLYFDKTSAQISNLVYRPGLVNIHDVAI